jgi:hypothetical protein
MCAMGHSLQEMGLIEDPVLWNPLLSCAQATLDTKVDIDLGDTVSFLIHLWLMTSSMVFLKLYLRHIYQTFLPFSSLRALALPTFPPDFTYTGWSPNKILDVLPWHLLRGGHGLTQQFKR